MSDSRNKAFPPGDASSPAPVSEPYRTMGIVAFVLSLFITQLFVQTVGLALGIVALVKSRKLDQKNGWALAAVITSSVLLVLTLAVLAVLASAYGSGRW